MHIIKKYKKAGSVGAYTWVINNLFSILQTGVLLSKPNDDKSMGPQVNELNMVTPCPICNPGLCNTQL